MGLNEDAYMSLPSDLKDSELVNSESFEASTSIRTTNSVIVIISTQLGVDDLNPIYLDFLIKLMKHRCFAGIIGEKKKNIIPFI